jgi:hypothetical protein
MNTGLIFADVQDALFEVMFQNELVLHLCKKWNQAYEDCLKRFCEREDLKLRQTAVVNGLALCGLARYEADTVSQLKQHTQEWHTVQVDFGDSVTFSMLSVWLTRWKADDDAPHTLVVEYYPHKEMSGGKPPFCEYCYEKYPHPPDMPAHLVEIPQVCFMADSELTQAQREEVAKWKDDFAEATALWLPTQRDAEGQEAALEAWRRDFGAWYEAWQKKLKEDRV